MKIFYNTGKYKALSHATAKIAESYRLRRFSCSGIFLIFFFCCMPVNAVWASQERITADGKIISGLSQEEALNKYGAPISISDKLWYYGGPEKLYVYLTKPLEVYLYPRFCNGSVGVPLELKILAGSREINDVTGGAEFFLSQPEEFYLAGQGVFVPKKAGNYQVAALYQGTYSNAGFISVTESKTGKEEDEVLLGMDIFPYKPYGNPDSIINFYAFGVFLSKGQYSLRDISNNAEWFSEQNNEISKLKDSHFGLAAPGKFKVFCRYGGLQSLPQDVEAGKTPVQLNHYLKQIAIVPPNISVIEQAKIPFHVFASYSDNSIEEVTGRVSWDISDKRILKKELSDVFVAESIGIAEVQAALDDFQSLPAKVVVSSVPIYKEAVEKLTKQKKTVGNLFEDIKSDVKKLESKITKENKFKYIKIVPNYCDIGAGEEKQLSAFGIRQDNTEEDITILGKWSSLDEKIAAVRSGLVNAVSTGETKICFQYRDMNSECIRATVREPKLVSIAVLPAQLKIVTGEEAAFRAQGFFGDSSRRDITLLASWVSANSGIARMDKNKIKSARAGKTKIYAQYSGIQSGPAEVEVAREKYWLLKLIAKTLLFLFLLLLILYSYFHMMTERTKERILKSYANPRDFIIALYGNLNKIMVIFGAQQEFYMPPLFFASLVDKKYAIEENLFFRFAERFEEAKYSSHNFPQEVSRLALEDYNQILKIMFARHKKMTIAYNYSKALISKVPLFIFNRMIV